MLGDLISTSRESLMSRTRAKASARGSPSTAPAAEQEHGVPLFLAQLSETLRLEPTATPFSSTAIGASAARHGGELLSGGYSISQVVHDYADVCQAIMELAVEQGASISPDELHTLNRCLDTAIAEAVTEYGRLKEEAISRHDLQHRGQIAHDLRNFVQTALLSFKVVAAGKAGASGSSGAVLGRSLVNIRDLADSIVSEVRLAAAPRHERVSLRLFIEELAATARLHAEYRNVQLTVEPIDPEPELEVDAELVASAVMNLVHNAFQYTCARGHVTIRAHAERGRAFVDVAANGGEVHTRDLPGKGRIFTVELPLASQPVG